MADDSENFKSWFTDVLAMLFPHRHAGLAILLITFPLLERYLRQRAQIRSTASLTDACMDDLRRLFPELASRDVARDFWQVYRNGLLHELTFSRKDRKGRTMPGGGASHDTSGIFIDPDGSFWVHPVQFAERVVRAIESDFATFSTDPSGKSSLPTVVVIGANALGPNLPEYAKYSIYLGTRGRP